jgi:hypothetical protein
MDGSVGESIVDALSITTLAAPNDADHDVNFMIDAGGAPGRTDQ